MLYSIFILAFSFSEYRQEPGKCQTALIGDIFGWVTRWLVFTANKLETYCDEQVGPIVRMTKGINAILVGATKFVDFSEITPSPNEIEQCAFQPERGDRSSNEAIPTLRK